ncbi:unnamed protein product [Rodentolepis nana]|uniref:Uncharacterized protein n=1 Tax=Rodentolepis nana TaxID=102285 RepID=A0A0R3TCL8_RODNA|nr:unnamed protein product [Rodentolepis nana]
MVARCDWMCRRHEPMRYLSFSLPFENLIFSRWQQVAHLVCECKSETTLGLNFDEYQAGGIGYTDLNTNPPEENVSFLG